MAIKAFSKQMGKLYSEKLVEIRLYGSRARGEQSKDSDVDLLIILKDFHDFWEEFKKISEYASTISLEFDVVISAIPIGESEWKARNTPLILNARREGVAIG
ncbi:MAG: nucleotidyltransferase domain-containing protein [Thermoplasmata archaeon]